MKLHVRRACLMAILSLVALLPNTSFAQKIIHVPADAPNIQAAVFSAQNGDTVLVAPGVYFESIAFQGRNITVMSSDGAAVTTVNSGSQPSAQFFDNENNGAVLKGFTFVNGSGIQIFSASPIIEDNVIANNQGCQAGGIMVSNGSPIIQRNTISNNRQFCTGGPAAGGIFVDGQGSVQILNNTITGNQTAPGVQAGGIFTDAFGTTTISGNKIQNNVTDAAGGGIYANGSNVIIAGNLITGNSASTGGGIQIAPGSNAIVVNNTVALNLAQQGAQLALDGMAGMVGLFNNVFYDLTGNGAIFCSMTGSSGFPPAQNNDAISFAGDPAGPLAVAYTGSCSDQTGFNGNVQAAPQFTDPVNGDFHLLLASPLIDAGTSEAPDLPAQDLDGNPRVAAGSNLCLPLVDIGAYEVVFNSVGSASLAPSSRAFGEWPIGFPNFFTLPVTLTGTQGCTQITSITTSSDYQQTSNCSVLRAGDSCTIQVTFAPRIAGLRMGTLKVNLLSPPATLTAELSGTGLNSATVTPAELNFGIQAIQTTQLQSVNVSSNGGQPLGVSSVTITGDFQQFSNCTQFSSNACFISVQFTPTVAGPRTGMLTVVSNLGTFAVPLSGDGAAPASSFSPTSLSFPTQTVGTASTPQPITLTNNGTANLLWNSVISTPDFQVSPGNCDQFLPPGASCTFSVVFAPTIIAPITGNMEIDTNGGAATASLTGIGTAPIASLNPQILNFANQTLNTSSAPQTITVTNISGAPLQLTSLSAPDNFLAASGCPAVLAVNASCGIDVTFGPTSSGPYGGFLTLGTSLGSVTAALTVGSPRTFHVPSEVPSIAQAVQLAQDGDTILVAPGTYFGQVSFQGKAITIASTGGAAVTTLDGQGFQTPVLVEQNEGPGSVLKGFTITHGAFAGVAAIEASPTIEDNIITENSGCFGAGLHLQTSSAIIKGNTISNNTIGNCGGDGAGIWIGQGGNVQVLNNVITGNQITGNGSGAGIAVSGATATITSNTIQNNSNQSNSTNFGNGGGIALLGGTANIIQNLITGNSASFTGGGIWVSLGTFFGQLEVFPPDQLINNTIADNFAPSGSGLFLSSSGGGAAFVNNLIIDSAGSTAIGCDSGLLNNNFSANDVFSFPGGTAYGPGCGDPTSIALNISQDPQFVNSATGNYRLQSSSPAIDAGTNFPGNTFPPPLPDRDLDGNGRILPGNPATCNGTIDLGAYEFASGANGTPGALPANWDFGSLQVGNFGQSFVFNLTAQGCVAIASIKTTGDFPQTNTCNNAVSRFCSITVSFNPQHSGLRTGSLTVDYGMSAPPVTVSLTGQGIDNPPLASPSSLNFAPQAVGSSSAAQQVSIFPNSAAPLTVNAIWISGDFSQTNACGATTVPPGGACVINVVFTPTASGTGQGNLTVSTNQGVVVVPLNGQINPLVILTPASLNLGSQLIGTNSVAQTATLTNSGTAAASIGAITVTGDYAQTNNCGTSLAGGANCTISVSFSPTVRGNSTGTLNIGGSFAGAPLTVSLSGAGQALLASMSTTSLTFAGTAINTTSPAQLVTLTNSGDLPISLSETAISADYAQTNNCGASVAVGASCTFSITFTPTVRGFDNGSLVVNGNFGTPMVVALKGTGFGKGPSAVLAPPFLVFTNQAPNTVSPAQQLTYTNTGDASISITSVFVRFGSFVQTNTCGSTLVPGASCTINVTYNPLDTGTQRGEISIGSTLSVSADLAGSSVPQLHTPATLNFGRQPINTTSPVQTITFTNSTSNPINFFGAASVSPFNLVNHCFGTLAVGASCTLDVTFVPTASGVFPGTIQLSGDFPGGQAIIPVVGTAPGAATFVPASLTFASQAVGFVSASQPVTITNNQDVSLNISGFQITGDFVQTNTCPTALIPGGSCTINISFLPSAVGARNGSLTITSDAGGVIAPLTLSGTGAVPAVGTITPQSLSFGTVPVNTQSTQQTVSLSNIGTAAMTVSVSISGNFTGDFIQTNNCGSSLPAGASCSINVVFTPTTGGTRTASLNVSGNSAPAVPSVNLTGIGGLPKATFSVTSLTFAPQLALTSSAAQSVTLSNTGGAPLSISGVSIFGIGTIDFTQTNNCGVSLAAGASCTINVVFTPSTRGARSATLSLSSNFSPAPNVSLSGTGQTIQLNISGGLINMGSQLLNTTSAPQPIVATNNGDFPASITGIAISGDYAQTNDCDATLAVGAACTITITFTPTARGTRSGSLNISGNFTFPQFLSLTGTGQALQGSVSPTTVTFADQALNTTSPAQQVVLTNSGDLALSISSVAVTGDFSQTNNCGTSLAKSLSCTISVTFTPTVLGQRSGSLSISTNSTTPLGPLNVFGKGIVLPPTFSPTSLTFASQTIGTTSVAQSVTLSNTTAAPIVINAITADGDFSQTNNCGTSLAVNTSCLVTVTFTPTARGSRTGTLSVTGQFVNLTFVNLSGTGQDFVASLTPTSFDFGNEPVNTTTNPHTFTYTNTGDLPLTISGVAVTPDFSQTNTCPATLAVGASCTISATFAPHAVGTQTASLTVSANINSSANLTGNGVMPTASLSPASLDFGHQRVDTASAPQLVTVTNIGAYAFFINQQVGFPSAYQVSNNCPSTLSPGASCTLSVVFAPTSSGSGAGSLTIGGNFTATPSSVSLSGTADASTGALSPTTLTFANQVVGSTSASQTVTLSSTGNVPINLSGIQTTGDFSQTNNCGTSVAAGTNCIITVTFTPTAHGTRNGSLSVSGDFTSAAPSATLSGNGTTPAAAWSPASLTFSNQMIGVSSSAQPVTLTNSGDGPLTISGISATGDFGQTNTCGSTLAPNNNCIINITFTPAATGSRGGSLSLSSNSSVAVSPVALAGTGVAPAAALSPVSLSFANQTVSTASVAQAATLNNTGTAPLTINNISVTGDFAQTNNCGTTLPAGANCTINVTFTPTGTGSRVGSLTLTDNSLGGSTQTASLSGTGINFSLSTSPSSVSINAGKTASFTVKVSALGSSFNSSVSLSCSGLPPNSSCSFSPATVTPGSASVNSTLQLSTTPRHNQTGTPAGAYTVTITGTSGSVQHSSTILLMVN